MVYITGTGHGSNTYNHTIATSARTLRMICHARRITQWANGCCTRLEWSVEENIPQWFPSVTQGELSKRNIVLKIRVSVARDAFHEYFTVSNSPVVYDDPAACSGRTPPNVVNAHKTDRQDMLTFLSFQLSSLCSKLFVWLYLAWFVVLCQNWRFSGSRKPDLRNR